MRASRAGMKRWNLNDVKRFVGFEFLEAMMNSTTDIRERALLAALYLTGGRASEILKLKKGDFSPYSEDPDNFVCVEMLVAKRYKKIQREKVTKWMCDGHCKRRWDIEPTPEEREIHNIIEYQGWVTEVTPSSREFVIHRKEIFASELISYVNSLKDFNEKLFNYSYIEEYNIAVKAGKNASEALKNTQDERLKSQLPIHTPPHWFRAQRASYLGSKGGYNDRNLAEYFKWESLDMALRYSKGGLREMADKLTNAQRGIG